MLQHLKVSLRALRKDPSTSIPAILALALGIGLTTAQFVVTDSLLLRGLPFADGHEIVHLEHVNRQANSDNGLSAHDYEIYRQQTEVFQQLVAYSHGTVNLSEPAERPIRLSGAFIAANFLEVLGVEPLHGRGFIPGVDDAIGAEKVALLSYSVWQSRYGGDLGILERPVRTNGELTTVVGILPEGFHFPQIEEVWIALQDPAAQGARGSEEEVYVTAFGRLAEGVSTDRAMIALSPLTQQIAAENPESHDGLTLSVQPFTHKYTAQQARATVGAMFFIVFLVLLVACFNVASLLLARAFRRTREIAIRTAMGASRYRAISLLLTESVTLSLLGALFSLPIAYFSVRFFAWGMSNMSGSTPFWFEIRMDFRTFVFCAAIAVFAGLLAGLLPALRASRSDVNEVLKDSSRGASSRRLGRLSRGLVLAEVAFSCALLVAAGVVVNNLRGMNEDVLTFDSQGLLTFRVGTFENSYPEPADQLRFYEELERRFEARGDVQDAAVSVGLPADTNVALASYVELEGETYERSADRPDAQLSVVSPSFFDLLDIEILDGRGFAPEDRDDHQLVTLVSQSFALNHFGSDSPLGRRLRISSLDGDEPQWRSVIGVVPDLIGVNLIEGDGEMVYVPIAQSPVRFAYVVVRPAASADPLAFTETARRVVEEQDANTPIYWVRTLDRVVAEGRVVHQLISGTFTIFGITALVLTLVGLYGLMAFSVRQRTQEIGVRMAFGARAVDVLMLVTGQGLRQVSVGLFFGILLAVPLIQSMRSFVYGADGGANVAIFAAVAVTFLLVAGVACFLPARRAAQVDPIHALQHD
ncbi:MAG: ABC transporter permease [Acidobacteriota bacterium]